MNIKCDNKDVGKLYVNLQLDINSFDGLNSNQIIDLIKGTNGQDKKVFSLSLGKFTISSFRRIYKNDGNIYVEGASLESAQ